MAKKSVQSVQDEEMTILMLPDLSENEAEQIAQKYQFTGGQIENISRKKLINYILNGKEVDFEKLCDYCEDEQIIDKTKRVGY